MKSTLISIGVTFAVAVLIYIAMLIFATGMYVETVGNIIVLSSISAGVVTFLTLRLRTNKRKR
jgi:hypothetical protein